MFKDNKKMHGFRFLLPDFGDYEGNSPNVDRTNEHVFWETKDGVQKAYYYLYTDELGHIKTSMLLKNTKAKIDSRSVAEHLSGINTITLSDSTYKAKFDMDNFNFRENYQKRNALTIKPSQRTKYRVIIPNVTREMLEREGSWDSNVMEITKGGDLVYYFHNEGILFDCLNKININNKVYHCMPDTIWKEVCEACITHFKTPFKVTPKNVEYYEAMKFVLYNRKEVEEFLGADWEIEETESGRFDLHSKGEGVITLDILNCWIVKDCNSRIRVLTEEEFEANFDKQPKEE